MLKTDRAFVTEFGVDEKKYYDYIDMISGKIAYPDKSMTEQGGREEYMMKYIIDDI